MVMVLVADKSVMVMVSITITITLLSASRADQLPALEKCTITGKMLCWKNVTEYFSN